MTDPEPGQDPETLEVALELLARTNEFLTLCMTRSEVAMESDDPQELIEALRAIRDGAANMARDSSDTSSRLIPGPNGDVRKAS